MKTCLYNFDPLKPHFYTVKLGFTGVYIIFLISAQKHRLWYSLEPPLGGYPLTSTHNLYFWAEIWKISEFLSENFQFLEVKYLNRRVFVMMFLTPRKASLPPLLGADNHLLYLSLISFVLILGRGNKIISEWYHFWSHFSYHVSYPSEGLFTTPAGSW